jgi:general secretion pathway protein M
VNWFRNNPRYAVMVLGTLALPALLLLYLAISLFGMRSGYQLQIERLEPRIARLQGLLNREEQVRDAARVVGSDVLDLVYPATDDAGTVSANLQKNVREILGAAGLSVSNSQILPVREKDGFDHIAVKLTASGGLPALDTALADLNAYLPLLLLESIEVWPNRSRARASEAEEQTITTTVQVLALKVRS